MNLECGQRVVYPGHGVVEVARIKELSVGGKTKEFAVFKTLRGGMSVMAALDQVKGLGVRAVTSKDEIELLIEGIVGPTKVEHTTWNRRYREYMEELSTGSFEKILKVAHSLVSLRTEKDLSFGERQMLDKAYDLMAQELTSVSKLSLEAAHAYLVTTIEERSA